MSGRMFTVPFDNITTLAAADTPQTIAAVFTADTLGHRCRIREIGLGCSEDAPPDLSIGIALKRATLAVAGSSTPVTPVKADSLSLLSIISGAKTYTIEPTVYGLALWRIDMHLQNTLLKEWDPKDAHPCNQNELLGLVITIRTAVARELSGHIKFEEF